MDLYFGGGLSFNPIFVNFNYPKFYTFIFGHSFCRLNLLSWVKNISFQMYFLKIPSASMVICFFFFFLVTLDQIIMIGFKKKINLNTCLLPELGCYCVVVNMFGFNLNYTLLFMLLNCFFLTTISLAILRCSLLTHGQLRNFSSHFNMSTA